MRAGAKVAASVIVVLVIGYLAFLVAGLFLPRGERSHPTTVIVTKTTGHASPLGREVVTSAFARVGEPLALRLDMETADPGSRVDAVFVPVDRDVPEAPFELTLFEDVDSAEEHAQLVQEAAGSKAEVARSGNAVLIVSLTVPAERRARLISTLESLQ